VSVTEEPPIGFPPTSVHLKPGCQAQLPVFCTSHVLVNCWPGVILVSSVMVTSLLKTKPRHEAVGLPTAVPGVPLSEAKVLSATTVLAGAGVMVGVSVGIDVEKVRREVEKLFLRCNGS